MNSIGAIFDGEELRVYMQRKNGQVLELTGFVERMSVSTTVDLLNITTVEDNETRYMPVETSSKVAIDMVAGEITWGDFLKPKRSTTMEWLCEWCDRPNGAERQTCASCGAVRPFLI